MELSLIILSLSLLISLFFIGKLYLINISLQKEMSNMKSTVDKVNKAQEDLISIDPGDSEYECGCRIWGAISDVGIYLDKVCPNNSN
jgi:hypothetical protein